MRSILWAFLLALLQPVALTGTAVYELPFGPGKALLHNGGALAHIARGWQLGGAAEYQPGALLNWGNLFFSGDVKNIKKEACIPVQGRWGSWR